MPPTPAVPAILVENLHKAYGRKVALWDLSLRVEPGEVFGFLGPNGAGKTTTIKVLLGLTRPTTGRALIFGRPAGEPAARRSVGYLPETFRFHDWLTGEALLDFHGRLSGMAAEQRRQRIPKVLKLVGLSDRGRDRIHDYSKGMAQRIGLAQALIHEPSLVLLDEPTSALDPIGRREVRELIRGLRNEGITVFLNSHLLSEVEMICDRVAIVDQGRVVRMGRLADLTTGRVELRLDLDRVDAPLRDLLRSHGEVLASDARSLTLGVADLEVAPSVAQTVVAAGYRLYGLVPRHESLEDVFVSLVEGHSA